MSKVKNKSAEMEEMRQDIIREQYLETHPEPDYDGTGCPHQAASKQVGGDHYKRHNTQPWHIIDEYELNFYEGNALKYLLRRKSDRKEDLEKCIHYLEKELEKYE
jgi:hypothetical protein